MTKFHLLIAALAFSLIGYADAAGISGTMQLTSAMITTALGFTPGPTPNAGQIVGTATNDNATAGNIGEYISSNILVGSQVAVTSATTANVTSVSLTAGDWDCRGEVTFNPAGATVQSSEIGAIGTTTATLPTIPGGGAYSALNVSVAAGVGSSFSVGAVRESLASTTTVYLLAQSTFTISTNAAYGFLGCRRAR